MCVRIPEKSGICVNASGKCESSCFDLQSTHANPP
jgi:hypothetical protein